MSHFNAEYENYYRNLSRSKSLDKKSKAVNDNSYLKSGIISSRTIGNRIIQEFAGTLILFLIVISIRFVATPTTISTYSYCKRIVNESYDFKVVEMKAQEIINDPSKLNIRLNFETWIKNLEINTLNIESILNNIKEKFNISSDSVITYIEYKENLFLITKLSGVIS
jgi:hypothetical protein